MSWRGLQAVGCPGHGAGGHTGRTLRKATAPAHPFPPQEASTLGSSSVRQWGEGRGGRNCSGIRIVRQACRTRKPSRCSLEKSPDELV